VRPILIPIPQEGGGRGREAEAGMEAGSRKQEAGAGAEIIGNVSWKEAVFMHQYALSIALNESLFSVLR